MNYLEFDSNFFDFLRNSIKIFKEFENVLRSHSGRGKQNLLPFSNPSRGQKIAILYLQSVSFNLESKFKVKTLLNFENPAFYCAV